MHYEVYSCGEADWVWSGVYHTTAGLTGEAGVPMGLWEKKNNAHSKYATVDRKNQRPASM